MAPARPVTIVIPGLASESLDTGSGPGRWALGAPVIEPDAGHRAQAAQAGRRHSISPARLSRQARNDLVWTPPAGWPALAGRGGPWAVDPGEASLAGSGWRG
jgi:hypothetical protein